MTAGPKPRIAVVGPGSVGCYFAAHLAAAGHDVISCARRPFDTYVVESQTAAVSVAAHVLTDPDDAPPVDWVLLCVKAQQTAGAAAWLERLCTPTTTVVIVQNGVEGVERTAPFSGAATLLPSVVYCGAELMSPGHIVHRSAGVLIVADTPEAHALAALCEGTMAKIRITDAYATEAWRKLGVNVMGNGITALTNRTFEVFARPDIITLAKGLLAEVWAVGRAEGADLTVERDAAFLDDLALSRAEGGTSTLYDRRAGRPTEHDALFGAVLRAADRHDIATPLTQAIGALVAAGDPG